MSNKWRPDLLRPLVGPGPASDIKLNTVSFGKVISVARRIYGHRQPLLYCEFQCSSSWRRSNGGVGIAVTRILHIGKTSATDARLVITATRLVRKGRLTRIAVRMVPEIPGGLYAQKHIHCEAEVLLPGVAGLI
ncbi:hypothetical protein PILCRDRAFT_828327 [Piloderma croceum F 1598]|uniref:Uncharacterized protein n=1 Tax=Piloderma croceum (strain F 1598) TaxID=765440 RepID=A0A0C3F2M8_PILCF|nr:hypothetical protein PILCRDRAFT_828327 [Piloderma croceum F 1598]